MFKSILLPLDGSPLSFKPMQSALELAKTMRGKLVILSVAEPRLFNSSSDDAVRDGGVVEAINLGAAQANIERALLSARASDVPCETVVTMSRVPCDDIVETARRMHCDVIMMATRGKTGVLDMLLNESTTQQVLKKSPVPVLIFP